MSREFGLHERRQGVEQPRCEAHVCWQAADLKAAWRPPNFAIAELGHGGGKAELNTVRITRARRFAAEDCRLGLGQLQIGLCYLVRVHHGASLVESGERLRLGASVGDSLVHKSSD